MGVSSTRVGDHRGSARTVQYLSKNHMMVSGLRSARSGALPHLAVFARQRALCVSPLSPLSSLSRLSIISLSLSLVSTWTCDFGLAVVCLSRCGSIPPRPLLSLSYPSPPPTRVGTCLLFQVSSFKLLGLEYPPCPPLPPRAALSRILGPLCWDTFHLPSLPPPSVWCERRERFRLALEPHGSPPSLSLRTLVCLIASSPPSISLRVCVCKRRELDLTLPLPSLSPPRWGSARTVQHLTLINLMMVRGLRSARSVSSHTWPFSRQSPVSCLSLSALSPPLDHLSLSLAESQNLGLGLLSLCGVCGVCEVCGGGVCLCTETPE